MRLTILLTCFFVAQGCEHQVVEPDLSSSEPSTDTRGETLDVVAAQDGFADDVFARSEADTSLDAAEGNDTKALEHDAPVGTDDTDVGDPETMDDAPDGFVSGKSAVTWREAPQVPSWATWVEVLDDGGELYVGRKATAGDEQGLGGVDFYAERRAADGAVLWQTQTGGAGGPVLEYMSYLNSSGGWVGPGHLDADGNYVSVLTGKGCITGGLMGLDMLTVTLELENGDLSLGQPLPWNWSFRRTAQSVATGEGTALWIGERSVGPDGCQDHLEVESTPLFSADDGTLTSLLAAPQAAGVGPHGGPATFIGGPNGSTLTLLDSSLSTLSAAVGSAVEGNYIGGTIRPVNGSFVAVSSARDLYAEALQGPPPAGSLALVDTTGQLPTFEIHVPGWIDTVIDLTGTEDFLAIGAFQCPSGGSFWLFVARYDASGAPVWRRVIPDIFYDRLTVNTARQLPNGSVSIARVVPKPSPWSGTSKRWRLDIPGAELVSGPTVGDEPCDSPF